MLAFHNAENILSFCITCSHFLNQAFNQFRCLQAVRCLNQLFRSNEFKSAVAKHCQKKKEIKEGENHMMFCS